MRRLREFVESSPSPRVLILSYHDFFYDNERCIPVISRFLNLEFDEIVTRAWSEMSRRFESTRREKQPLTAEQEGFIRDHADREAEAWVLDRIEQQWTNAGLYVEESVEGALDALGETEAKAWRLARQVKQLEHELARERRKSRRLRRENQSVSQRLQALRDSRTWRLLDKVNRLRLRVLGGRSSGRAPEGSGPD